MVNVVRHAGAAHCRVSVTRQGDALAVQVTDDGRGVRPSTSDGVDLTSTRDRVVARGGTLDVVASRSGGTRFELRLPAWTGA